MLYLPGWNLYDLMLARYWANIIAIMEYDQKHGTFIGL
jgi:hypothetical protein